jgi:hypothetical protein
MIATYKVRTRTENCHKHKTYDFSTPAATSLLQVSLTPVGKDPLVGEDCQEIVKAAG